MHERDLIGRALVLILLSIAAVAGARAAVSEQEAAALGTTLTAVGAERAGSADGRIPAFTGGLQQAPPGPKPRDGHRADPFADEKPVQSITAANAGQSAAELTFGTLELLRRHPAFRVDVYPTHRTVGYPSWLLENTRRNATTARAKDSGLVLVDALPGVPFPIPRDGREVMWNHRIHYMGRAFAFKYDSWLVDGAGQKLLTSTAQSTWEFPVFEPKRTKTIEPTEPYFQWRVDYTGPQRRAGEALLLIEPVDLLKAPRLTWFYVPGQRRAKQIEFPDDALHSSSSGVYTNDDAFVYTGMLERYDVKLLGKREMLVPYNTYRFTYHTRAEDMLLPGHLNPDYLRWELHRVWVVEATLKPGEHHVYSRRLFYIDEDACTALASDEFLADGTLARSVFALLSQSYDAGVPFSVNHFAVDFGKNSYYVAFLPGPHSGVKYVEPLPAAQWSPDSMVGAGVR
jgi:GNAT superfamily N-acetyltransferase